MIYTKIKRTLVINKQIFNYYYNSNFSLEMTWEVENVDQKQKFTHKLTTNRNFQKPSLFFSSTVREWKGLWDIKDSKGYIYAAFKNKSDEGQTGSEANIRFGCASYLEMHLPKEAFLSFQMQPGSWGAGSIVMQELHTSALMLLIGLKRITWMNMSCKGAAKDHGSE